MGDSKRPFRLAIRDEGLFVACYLARTGSMERAVLIERMEALTPRRAESYSPERFALVLNAVLTAGLDAIERRIRQTLGADA